MARNLENGLNSGLRRSIARGLGSGDVFTLAPLDLRFAQQKTLDSRITFTRASSGTYVGSDGLIKTATTNEARFDHNPTTGESLGLLVEEQRTNLLLRSEEFDNASWTQNNITVSANNTTAPNGLTTAEKIAETSANNEHNALQAVTVASNTSYTLTCYAKKGERNILALSPTAPGVSNYYTWFNLDTGTIGTSASGNTATITSVGNGWYRCSISRTTGASQTTINVKLGISNADSTSSYTGDGTSGIYLWGAQLEAGSFPTSYIPTTSATVTRSADVASITGANFSSWYRQDEGTVALDFSLPTTAGNTAIASFFQAAAPSTNRHSIRQGNSIITTAGSQVANFTNQTAAVNTRSKIAYGYKVDDFFQILNGTTSASDTSGAVPASIDQLDIGKVEGASIYSNGPIRRLTYWPSRLANSTLQEITR